MSGTERRKGVRGEREVAAIYERAGLTVRGLESGGDHLIACDDAGSIRLHSEVKRQEVARPWLWFEQASREAPADALPVVAFRRNRSSWLAIVPLAELAELVALAGDELAARNRRAREARERG